MGIMEIKKCSCELGDLGWENARLKAVLDNALLSLRAYRMVVQLDPYLDKAEALKFGVEMEREIKQVLKGKE